MPEIDPMHEFNPTQEVLNVINAVPQKWWLPNEIGSLLVQNEVTGMLWRPLKFVYPEQVRPTDDQLSGPETLIVACNIDNRAEKRFIRDMEAGKSLVRRFDEEKLALSLLTAAHRRQVRVQTPDGEEVTGRFDRRLPTLVSNPEASFKAARRNGSADGGKWLSRREAKSGHILAGALGF